MSAGSLRAASRTVTFAPGAVAAAVGWVELGRPLDVGGAHSAVWHAAGFGAMLAAGLLIWPALVMTLLMLNSSVLAGLFIPRRVRSRYRRQHGRTGARSAYISKRLRRVTYAADRYRCVYCKVRYVPLEIDHVYPWIAGGLTVLWNCMTLCSNCNGIKLNYNVDTRDGYVHYAGDRRCIPQAALILAREKRARRNPLRMVRAAWALAR
jgi:HNH endonuclease